MGRPAGSRDGSGFGFGRGAGTAAALSSLLATCASEGSRTFPPMEPVYSAYISVSFALLIHGQCRTLPESI